MFKLRRESERDWPKHRKHTSCGRCNEAWFGMCHEAVALTLPQSPVQSKLPYRSAVASALHRRSPHNPSPPRPRWNSCFQIWLQIDQISESKFAKRAIVQLELTSVGVGAVHGMIVDIYRGRRPISIYGGWLYADTTPELVFSSYFLVLGRRLLRPACTERSLPLPRHIGLEGLHDGTVYSRLHVPVSASNAERTAHFIRLFI